MPTANRTRRVESDSERINVSINKSTHTLIEKVTDITGQKISRFSDAALLAAATEEAKRLKSLGHKIAA